MVVLVGMVRKLLTTTLATLLIGVPASLAFGGNRAVKKKAYTLLAKRAPPPIEQVFNKGAQEYGRTLGNLDRVPPAQVAETIRRERLYPGLYENLRFDDYDYRKLAEELTSRYGDDALLAMTPGIKELGDKIWAWKENFEEQHMTAHYEPKKGPFAKFSLGGRAKLSSDFAGGIVRASFRNGSSFRTEFYTGMNGIEEWVNEYKIPLRSLPLLGKYCKGSSLRFAHIWKHDGSIGQNYSTYLVTWSGTIGK